MVARLFYLVLIVAMAAVVSPLLVPLAAAQTVSPGGAGAVATMKRSQFRPLLHQAEIAAPRRSGSVSDLAWQSRSMRTDRRDADLFGSRAGVRKAVPVTRGQELGLQFRPDERASPYAQGVAPATQPGSGSAEEPTAFRPLRPRRKPTYEELQRQAGPSQQTIPMTQPPLPYPALPAAPYQLPRLMPPAWPVY